MALRQKADRLARVSPETPSGTQLQVTEGTFGRSPVLRLGGQLLVCSESAPDRNHDTRSATRRSLRPHAPAE